MTLRYAEIASSELKATPERIDEVFNDVCKLSDPTSEATFRNNTSSALGGFGPELQRETGPLLCNERLL